LDIPCFQAEFGSFERLFLGSGWAGCKARLWGVVLVAPVAMGSAKSGCNGPEQWQQGCCPIFSAMHV